MAIRRIREKYVKNTEKSDRAAIFLHRLYTQTQMAAFWFIPCSWRIKVFGQPFIICHFCDTLFHKQGLFSYLLLQQVDTEGLGCQVEIWKRKKTNKQTKINSIRIIKKSKHKHLSQVYFLI